MPEVRDNPAEHRYEIVDGDELAGIAQYELEDSVIAFTHTESFPGHDGKGLARQLVEYALADARARRLAVLPKCPYVRKIIAGSPSDYLALVPHESRAAFGLPLD